MGGTFAFVKNASANLREKDDTWNTTWAGLAAGSLVGLRGMRSQTELPPWLQYAN